MDTQDWLSETLASDVMVRDVETLPPHATLADAAALLLREQISGAPVVDERGGCVGVLSVTDFLFADAKVATQRRREAESTFWNSGLALPVSVYAERLEQVRDRIAPSAEQPVEHFMTSDVVSVCPDTPLKTVVHDLVEAHIHRVIVLDEQRKLLGVISTTDVLAALLRCGSSSRAAAVGTVA